MEKRLKWNAVGLNSKTEILKEKIEMQFANTPIEHLKVRKTLQIFATELQNIITTIGLIDSKVIPLLEKNLRLHFTTPEMIYLALCRPSMNNIFKQLYIHFKDDIKSPITEAEFRDLYNIGDVGIL